MPKGPLSFGDGLQRIIGDLAQMELDPSADRNLINQIRETIIGYQQQVGQTQAPGMGPDAGPGAIPGTLEAPAPAMPGMEIPMEGLPVPVPTTEADLSRGPRPGIDTQGAADELARIMAGS